MATSRLRALFGENARIETMPPINPVKKEILEAFSLRLRLDSEEAEEREERAKKLEDQGLLSPCRIRNALSSASL